MSANSWAVRALQTGGGPRAVFSSVLGALARTESARELLVALTGRVTFAFARSGTIARTGVEHEETMNDPGATAVSFLSFLIQTEDRTVTLDVGPPTQTTPRFEAPFWTELGYIECCECKLLGAHRTSIWENDPYKLDAVRDEQLLARLTTLSRCAIENGEYQWVVSDQAGRSFSLVTGLLNEDHSGRDQDDPELLELDAIEARDLGEIYLRLLCGIVFGQASKQVLRPNYLVADATPADPYEIVVKLCDLSTIDDDWASTLPRETRKLELYGCELAAIPEGLRQLAQLEDLTLTSNRITTVPDWLCELRQLKRLSLSCNPLDALPRDIGSLERLEAFDCVGAKLRTLPDSITQLRALKSLDLRANQIAALPATFGALRSLEWLDVSSNQLSRLPESFAALSNLKKLDLAKNPIDFDPAIYRLVALESLRIDAAAVTSIGDQVGHLRHLRSLHADRNAIRELPSTLLQLPALEHLSLSNNALEVLPDLGLVTKLMSFHADENRLHDVASGFRLADSLREVWLQRNQLRDFPREALGEWKGGYVDLRDNPIEPDARASLRACGTRVML
ncbi:MAG TPA: leucine-rich repeat domain-containing protein [Kofleriaceae bacterium]|nr:leucine-rich repeat domain-containing protein [Kofleriaceae bacterium]